jgi:hypothetical protein
MVNAAPTTANITLEVHLTARIGIERYLEWCRRRECDSGIGVSTTRLHFLAHKEILALEDLQTLIEKLNIT